MRILLADDDSDLLDVTAYALQRRGHTIITASDGIQALHRWQSDRPDLVLLDVRMPRMDGMEVCRSIRRASPVPIILISSHADEDDFVRGYESGADDYIVKPFSVRRLLVRGEALMRRIVGAPPADHTTVETRLQAGDLTVDLMAFEALKNGVRLSLTPLEFRVLSHLVRYAGTVVETRRLADHAWQSSGTGDSALLKTHVSHLRQKLAEAGGAVIDIRAIPRTGYLLQADTRPAPVFIPRLQPAG